MIAVVQIGGHQEIVTVGDIIEVDKIDAKEGAKVQFETLLVSEEDGGKFQIGTPFIEGVQVEAKIVEHGRGDKIRVYKMKPRKRYRRTRNHRQDYTVIEITSVGGATKSSAKKTEEKKELPKKEKKESSAKKTPAKKTPAKKTSPTKKSTTKKAPAKKSSAKKK